MRKTGKFGLIDFSGNKITSAIYEEISSVKYKEGEIYAKKDGKYGIINNKGVELIPFKYDQIESDKYYDRNYEKAGYIVRITEKDGYSYGYINSNWETVLEPEYTDISRILDINSKDVYLIVAKNGRYGVTKNANVEIDFLYQSIIYDSDVDFYIVQKSGQYGVINRNGKNILDTQYKDIHFNGAYIACTSYTGETYFNKKGEKIENGTTTLVEVPSQNVSIISNENSMYGIIGKNGEEIVKTEYRYIEYAFDNCFIAYKDGRGLGAIDKDGNTLIDFEYDVLNKIGEYKLLRAIDIDEKRIDIYNSKMEKILSVKNASIEDTGEYLEIYSDEESCFVTPDGEVKSAKDILTTNKLFAVYEDGKWGFENKQEEKIVPCEYECVTELNKFGFAGVKKDGKWGVINADGKLICDTKYDFGEEIRNPYFLGNYYKTYTDYDEMYYSDQMINEK